MDVDAHVSQARTIMREHGYFIQGVAPGGLADPVYCYTVGLQRLPVPRPEVIIFGLDTCCAADVLHRVHEQVRVDGPLPRGEVVPGLFDQASVRVDEVRPEWVEAYAGMVAPLLRRRAHDVPMLQLVLPDDAGRWPEDPAVDPAVLVHQPLLAHAVPWRTPLRRDPVTDIFHHEQPGTVLVAAPVVGPRLAEGRYELLRAEQVRPGAVRISDVPLLADHVAVGDVVAVHADDDVPGLPPEATVMGALLEAGGWDTLAFRLPPPQAEPARLIEMTTALFDLGRAGHARLATSASTLHVNTPTPAAVDTALRPFVRDGLLRPTALRSTGDPCPPPVEDCPDCQAARRSHH